MRLFPRPHDVFRFLLQNQNRIGRTIGKKALLYSERVARGSKHVSRREKLFRTTVHIKHLSITNYGSTVLMREHDKQTFSFLGLISPEIVASYSCQSSFEKMKIPVLMSKQKSIRVQFTQSCVKFPWNTLSQPVEYRSTSKNHI